MTLDALALEVRGELDRYTIRKRVSVVHLDVTFDIKLARSVKNANLELVLVVDEARHVVMVAAPAISDLLSL